jgi:hypothetical protein
MISRIEELLRNNQAFVEHQLQLDAGSFDTLSRPASGVPVDRLLGQSGATDTVSRAPVPATCSCTGTSRTWPCKPT